MSTEILIPIVISFAISLFFVPFWIRKAKQIGLVWHDMNKVSNNKVSGSGGIIAVLAFLAGLIAFVAYRVFFLHSAGFLVEIFALMSVILILTGIGLVDDLLGWQRGGLSKRSRIILVLLASVPLVAINAGKAAISIPIIGTVDLGILYPLILIPLGIVGAATTFNFLAGFNGLEAGQGILILSGLSLVAYLTGSSWLAVIGLCMVFALVGFIFYNWYPAQVFPGDSLTYAVGGLIACMAILGNFEKIAVFFFIPVIIEVILKARGGLVKHSFGKPNTDGSLDLKYDKIYSLNHAAIALMKRMSIKATEQKVVCCIMIFQIIIIILGFILFGKGIF